MKTTFKFLSLLLCLITVQVQAEDLLVSSQQSMLADGNGDKGHGGDTDGQKCAAASMDKFDYVVTDCAKIKSSEQDACAADSIELLGDIDPLCFSL